MAADVLEFMEQQRIAKAHIGGYSMGGAITGTLLRRKPQVFNSAHLGGAGITELEEFRSMIPPDKTGTAPDDVKAREAYANRPARGASVGNNGRRPRYCLPPEVRRPDAQARPHQRRAEGQGASRP